MKNIKIIQRLCAVAGLLFVAGSGFSNSASGDLTVEFNEGAPKDRFSLTNGSACSLLDLTIVIDLSKSDAQLIFDTTAKGEGVEVFQPFERVKGQFEVAKQVVDGAQQVSLQIKKFPAGETLSFTIDVDDTLQSSELGNIRVSSAEMQGSEVILQMADHAPVKGTFGFDNQASVEVAACSDES